MAHKPVRTGHRKRTHALHEHQWAKLWRGRQRRDPSKPVHQLRPERHRNHPLNHPLNGGVEHAVGHSRSHNSRRRSSQRRGSASRRSRPPPLLPLLPLHLGGCRIVLRAPLQVRRAAREVRHVTLVVDPSPAWLRCLARALPALVLPLLGGVMELLQLVDQRVVRGVRVWRCLI